MTADRIAVTLDAAALEQVLTQQLDALHSFRGDDRVPLSLIPHLVAQEDLVQQLLDDVHAAKERAA